MCAGACVWARIGAVVYGVSQEDIAAYGRKRGTEDYKWRACLIPCRLVFGKGNHGIRVTGGFLLEECRRQLRYRLELCRPSFLYRPSVDMLVISPCSTDFAAFSTDVLST